VVVGAEVVVVGAEVVVEAEVAVELELEPAPLVVVSPATANEPAGLPASARSPPRIAMVRNVMSHARRRLLGPVRCIECLTSPVRAVRL
jgi:hypothetical protein